MKKSINKTGQEIVNALINNPKVPVGEQVSIGHVMNSQTLWLELAEFQCKNGLETRDSLLEFGDLANNIYVWKVLIRNKFHLLNKKDLVDIAYKGLRKYNNPDLWYEVFREDLEQRREFTLNDKIDIALQIEKDSTISRIGSYIWTCITANTNFEEYGSAELIQCGIKACESAIWSNIEDVLKERYKGTKTGAKCSFGFSHI